jgi:hypothetical protein
MFFRLYFVRVIYQISDIERRRRMQAITEQDWQILPDYAQREVYDFFLFIRERYVKTQLSQDELETRVFSNHSANTVAEWLDEKEDELWT